MVTQTRKFVAAITFVAVVCVCLRLCSTGLYWNPILNLPSVSQDV